MQDGVNTFIFELGSAMMERGIDVNILGGCGQVSGTDVRKRAQYMFDVNRVPPVVLLKDGVFRSILQKIAYWTVRGPRALHEFRPEAMIMNGVLPLYSKAFRVAVCHGLRNQGTYPPAQKYYDILMYRRVDRIVAVAEPLRKELAMELGLKDVVIIPIGLDTRKYAYRSYEGRNMAILQVGTRSVKNLKTTLQAFKTIATEIPEARLFVTGSTCVSEYSLDQKTREKVSFLNIISKQELRRLYSEVLIVCAPSYYEAFHYATLEAFASGTPVVGSEAIPNELLINDFNGFKVSNPADHCELAHHCINLLTDALKWKKLSRNARTTALKYDIRKVVDSYLTLIQ